MSRERHGNSGGTDCQARLRKGPGLCGTEKSDEVSQLFFTVLHTVIAVWVGRFPPSTDGLVPMALSNVRQSILSADTIPSRGTVLSTVRARPGSDKKSDSQIARCEPIRSEETRCPMNLGASDAPFQPMRGNRSPLLITQHAWPLRLPTCIPSTIRLSERPSCLSRFVRTIASLCALSRTVLDSWRDARTVIARAFPRCPLAHTCYLSRVKGLRPDDKD